MSVKRYEMKTKYRGNESWDELEEGPDGMYVRYEDYAESHRALRAETTAHENTQMQLEKMAAENTGLNAFVDALLSIAWQGGSADGAEIQEMAL